MFRGIEKAAIVKESYAEVRPPVKKACPACSVIGTGERGGFGVSW